MGSRDATVVYVSYWEAFEERLMLTQSETPTVSVVIPTFNRSALIGGALESVLQQTYKDYEIIVIDDGSTDDTRDRLNSYMKDIRYVFQDNKGASAAQNKGIQLARGKWVSILGSDDRWLPAKLERQLTVLTALGNDFGACFTDCVYVGNPRFTLSAFEEAGLKCTESFGPLDNPLQYLFAEDPPLCVQSSIVLRSLLQDLNGFDESMVVGEDVDLLFRMTFRTRFCLVSAPLVKIDRTPSESRLTDLLSHKSDRIYASLEHRHRKWFSCTERLDNDTRRALRDRLRLFYYGWTADKLTHLELRAAREKITAIRELGDGYFTIVGTLISESRTLKKLRNSRFPWVFGRSGG